MSRLPSVLFVLLTFLLLPAATCLEPAECDECFVCGPGTHEEDGVCVPDVDDDDVADDDDAADDDDSAVADDDATDDDDVADDDDAAPGCDDWIVFVGRRTGQNEIWRMHSDGSDLLQLTSGGAGGKSYPALSPDCSEVLYVDTGAWEMRSVGIDGTDDVLVIAAATDEQIRNPAWSPDGGQIAYDSNLPGPNKAVWTADPDGSNAAALTDGSAPTGEPRWKPDGSQFVVSTGSWPSDIATMDLSGGNVTPVTDANGGDTAPKWSPDGSQILFQSTRDGGSYIYVIDADGSNLTQLTDFGEERPTWSPDGSQIAFRSDRDGNSEIYVADSDGSNPVNVSNDGAFDGGPDWR